MISRELGWITWYVLIREFQTEQDATEAFMVLREGAAEHDGSMNLGCYRLIPAETGGPHLVVGVSHSIDGIDWASQTIGGVDTTMPNDVIEAMILRRAKVVLDLYERGQTEGSYHLPKKPGGITFKDLFDAPTESE